MAEIKFKGFYFGKREFTSAKGLKSATHSFMDGYTGDKFDVRFDGEVKATAMIPYEWTITGRINTGKEFKLFISADEIIGESIADKIQKRKEVS